MKIVFIPLPWDKIEFGCVSDNDDDLVHECQPNAMFHPRSFSTQMSSSSGMSMLTAGSQCSVTQQLGRNFNYPALSLDSAFYDTSSPLHMHYAIGTSTGNVDVKGWTQYHGAVQVLF